MNSQSKPSREKKPPHHKAEKTSKEAQTAPSIVADAPASVQANRKKTPYHCEITYKEQKTWWNQTKPFVELAGVVLLAVYTLYTVKMYRANKEAADAAQSAANTAALEMKLSQQQLSYSRAARVEVQVRINQSPEGIWKPYVIVVNSGHEAATSVQGNLEFSEESVQSRIAIGTVHPFELPIPYPLTPAGGDQGVFYSNTNSWTSEDSFSYFVPVEAQQRLKNLQSYLRLKGEVSYFNGVDPKKVTENVCLCFVYRFDSNTEFFPCRSLDWMLGQSTKLKQNIQKAQSKNK